jgi:hypothetical protein
MRHTGYCIGGQLVVRMIDTGIETHIGAGDFFEIPPGHDAYVEGNDRVELILFGPRTPALKRHPVNPRGAMNWIVSLLSQYCWSSCSIPFDSALGTAQSGGSHDAFKRMRRKFG